MTQPKLDESQIDLQTVTAYDIAVFLSGAVSSVDQEIVRFRAPRSFTIPSGLTGSQGNSRTPVAGSAGSPSDATFSIRKNDAEIGKAVFAAGSPITPATFSGAGGSFAVGDDLTVVALTADSGQQDISIVIKGTIS